jgi:hypothetical protein
LVSILAYILYFTFCIGLAENFWTHDNDSFGDNYFTIDVEETGYVDFEKLDLEIGIQLTTIDPKFEKVILNATERKQYI